MKQVPWTRIILDEFTKLAGLTEIEQEIMSDRMSERTATHTCLRLAISESTYARYVRRLKKKYDLVQPHSDKLPPRRFSAKETYMDTH